ncbi:uncharacterized protein LOC122091570 [Macadamia integrifolia]|uniref:uncharacterized protein LOC122091570 n=1 Tax=Macadamia integrifolia TaxID=60698 RepID=UPI001C4F916A|nr:uncharacterized protein LOC122091570 [Macadamia integrifolia]
MENSVAEGKIAEASDSVRKPVRRRLIQSTLFPDRFPSVRVKEEIGEDKAVEEEDDDDAGEECRGSASTGKSKRKRKAKSQPKAATKDPVTGNQTPGERTESRRSPVTFGKRGPQQSKKKPKKANATPSKSPKSGGLKGAYHSHSLTIKKLNAEEDKDIHSEDTSQPVTDLRLEAKITAEENARLFAGKQTHPFFSLWKAGKKVQETLETTIVDKKCYPLLNEDESTCGPIHVFEVLQEDNVFLDWRNWEFNDRTSPHSTFASENSCSPVFEGSVYPLKFENFLSMSGSLGASLLQSEVPLDQSNSQVKMLSAVSPTAFSTSSDLEVAQHWLLKYFETVHERDRVGFFSGNTGCASNSDLKLQDRIKPYYDDCANLPRGMLWTNKYEPGKAFQVCGNDESVRFLNEWLRSWHERYLKKRKKSTDDDECSSQDSEDSSYQIGSDTENMDEGRSLKNVLLVTGPVGSGKSSAIYACAREQGFEVIEVSASDWRNGTVLREKFGEAVESHRFKWTKRNPTRLCKKPTLELVTNQQISKTVHEFNNELIELTSSADEEELAGTKKGSWNDFKNNGTACGEGAKKTLILFEDVDIIFYDDRGFITAIQQFAKTARCPIILTSNCEDPLLPDNLDRLEVCFAVPSLKELVSHIYMVCAAEKVDIQPKLIERIVECCQGDIRKTIMLLQFWSQGGQYQDKNVHRLYGPLQFDLEAGHWILPKVIPWGFPCQLSDLVEKEITKSLSLVQDNACLTKTLEEELNAKETQDAAELVNTETESIVAKKESMLSRNCSFHEGNQFSARLDNVYDLPDLSGSPVISTQKSSKRQRHMVVYSDSEDEFSSDNPPVKFRILSGYPSNDILSGMSVRSIVPEVGTQDLDQSADQHHTEREKSEGNHHKCFETESDRHITEREKWIDVSFVPESSFVPETEISNGVPFLSRTVSCDNVSVTVEAVSTSFDESMQRMPPMEVDNIEKTMSEFQHNSENRSEYTFNVNAELVNGDGEVGDSQNEHLETATGGYQVMDECSRINFHNCSPVENPWCTMEGYLVQEKWQKLRRCRTDLKSYITPQQRDAYQMVKLTSQMTCLISDADLMLGCCQLLVSDSLEASMVPCVEPDSFCWYHDQVEMASITAQHGLGFYEKESAAKALNLGSRNRVDLAWEMLTSTTNTTAMGKLITQDMNTSQTSCGRRCLDIKLPRSGISMDSLGSRLYGTVQSMVPPKSYFALMGAAIHEYMFTLGQISRSETSRLSEHTEKTERRRRSSQRHGSQHYLNSGALMLSEEDLVFLAQQSCYGKVTSESMGVDT